MSNFSIATKGCSHLLLNTTKKEKHMKDKEDQEQKMEELVEHNSEMKKMITDMRSELVDLRKKNESSEKNEDILHNLLERAIIDEEGNLI